MMVPVHLGIARTTSVRLSLNLLCLPDSVVPLDNLLIEWIYNMKAERAAKPGEMQGYESEILLF